MIIAIDGPAASGKGTIARRLAARYGLPHLDTGLLYRAAAAALIGAGRDLYDESAAVAAARGLGLTDFDEDRLRSRDMGEAASIVAAMPGVRQALIDAQRAFAARPGGAVLDGRDIGTVVCPDADVKIFVTASAFTRAQRRALELAKRGERADYAAILADIQKRDARDFGEGGSALAAGRGRCASRYHAARHRGGRRGGGAHRRGRARQGVTPARRSRPRGGGSSAGPFSRGGPPRRRLVTPPRGEGASPPAARSRSRCPGAAARGGRSGSRSAAVRAGPRGRARRLPPSRRSDR